MPITGTTLEEVISEIAPTLAIIFMLGMGGGFVRLMILELQGERVTGFFQGAITVILGGVASVIAWMMSALFNLPLGEIILGFLVGIGGAQVIIRFYRSQVGDETVKQLIDAMSHDVVELEQLEDSEIGSDREFEDIQ